MVTKHKKYSGVKKTTPAGRFDTRLRKGPTGLTRGTAKLSPKKKRPTRHDQGYTRP
jgi:hypothetical protein